MPTVFKPTDVYLTMRALANQATGRSDIEVVDHNSFIDAGTITLETGVDNVIESVAKLIGRVYFDGRPYTGKVNLINFDSTEFNDRHARVSFYTKYNCASAAFNTDLYTNIKDGYDNGTNGGNSAPDMWLQDLPMVVERFFTKESVWMKRVTYPLVQLQAAFRDEGEFLAFMNQYATVVKNELELYIENRNRALIADRIAGIYAQVQTGKLGKECAVDITKYFQEKTGDLLSRDDIIHKHLTELLEIYFAKLKIDSDRLTEYSIQYHDPMHKTEGGEDYWILDHTPKSEQRILYTKEFFEEARARVMPELFGPQFIPENQGEALNFWQSDLEGERYRVKCKPALPDTNISDEVDLDYVLGLIFDSKAMRANNQYEGVYSTPIEAAKLYKNEIYHFKYGAYTNYLANSILYYMSEYGDAQKSASFVGDGTEVEFVIDDENAKSVLKITVNGTEVDAEDYAFDADSQTITFTTAPADEAVIDVDYLVI